ncbi:MAG: ribosome maturation factor RimP [Syntrophomonadaceae bacterium]
MSHKGLITPQVVAAINDKLERQGIELCDIEYRRESSGLVLRIYIDTAAGVDTDTCVAATRTVKDYLDDELQLDYDYLEISSPGIDRILKREKELVRYRGSRVLVKTSQAVDGKKKFIGILGETDASTLKIEVEGQVVSLNREIVSLVRLHPEI